MTLYLSSGYFQGPNVDANGDPTPFDWSSVGNWYVNGISQTGFPGTQDLGQLGLSGTNFGYEVSVSREQVSSGELQFTFSNTASPIAYSQDLVQEVIGNGAAGSASLRLGSVSGVSIAGNRSNNGYVVLSQGGTLQVAGTTPRTASIVMGNYTNLYDGSSPATVDQLGSNDNVVSIGTAGQTGYNYLTGFAAPIYGLVGNDKIVLSQIAYSPAATYTWAAGGAWPVDGTHGVLANTFSTPGILTVSENGTIVAQLNVALPTDQSTGASAFHLANDNGSLAITDACYLAGTRILTDRGEVAVEHLAVGDRVLTERGAAMPIVWIGERNHAGPDARRTENAPVVVKAGALAEQVPVRDLYVSPEHALFLDGVLVPARELVNGVTVLLAEHVGPIRYFHIELPAHQVIYAEGAPAESFVDCDNRTSFENAAEFARMYPDANAPQWTFCAPIVERGEQLAAIRRGLLLRARQLGAVIAQDGPMSGHLDRADREQVSGWARLDLYPDIPVRLEVLADGVLVGETVAARYRADLEAAGLGHGRYAFSLLLPEPLDPFNSHEIVVRRQADGQHLANSPHTVPAAGSLDAVARSAVANVLHTAMERAGDHGEADAFLHLLQAATEQARGIHAGLVARATPSEPSRRGGPTARRRALVIDTEWPRPARDAGSQAMWSHMQSLQRLGWQVELVAAGEMTPGEPTARLAEAGIVCHARPAVATVEEVLRRHAGQFGLVYLHRVENALAYAGLARLYQREARLLYSVADLHFLRLEREARTEARLDLAREAASLRERELFAMRQVDAVLTHSPYEAELLGGLAPAANVHVVPWAVAARSGPASWDARAGVVFVAYFGHRPNLYAAHWLLHEIMPLVWARDPSIPCTIAGTGLPRKLVNAVDDPRVRLLGHVPDLGETYRHARMAIAPLLAGAGIKGKVLEAFAAGLPCAMTPTAAEGLPLSAPLCELVAADASGLAELILRLHADRVGNEGAGEAGLALVSQHFSDASTDAALSAALKPSPITRKAARGTS